MIEVELTTEPLLVDGEAAARLLGISVRHLLSLDSGGRIPQPVRLGRRRLWVVEELRAWARAGCPARDQWRVIQEERSI